MEEEATAEVSEIRLIMIPDKDTSNTRRFQEVAPPGTTEHISKVYLQKKSLRVLGNPQGLEVVIRPLKQG